MARQPVFYIPHGGGPCFFMDWTPPDTWNALAAWLRALPGSLPEPPTALLVISAHWEERDFTLATTPDPGLLFDYYGFPPHTYELQWPAPPAPHLFPPVRQLLAGAGIPLGEDPERDFDHGVFVPLLLPWPRAAIPTLQISMRHDLDPAAHIALGRALAPLRDQGDDEPQAGPFRGAGRGGLDETILCEQLHHEPAHRHRGSCQHQGDRTRNTRDREDLHAIGAVDNVVDPGE